MFYVHFNCINRSSKLKKIIKTNSRIKRYYSYYYYLKEPVMNLTTSIDVLQTISLRSYWYLNVNKNKIYEYSKVPRNNIINYNNDNYSILITSVYLIIINITKALALHCFSIIRSGFMSEPILEKQKINIFTAGLHCHKP